MTPLVSICCLAYNHEPYIRDCLDGFVTQKTDFPFEVLIHDDASTDKTAEVIREYESKYPQIIKPVYQTENKYSKGVKVNSVYNFARARGQYIALCEGDDYWTNPLKLQVQVDFLEANPDYSMCFHNAMLKWEDGREGLSMSNLEDRDYSGEELYENFIVPTASCVVRKDVFESDLYKIASKNKNFCFGDIVMWLTASECGKIRAMSDSMSVYRKHVGGVIYAATPDRIKNMCIHNVEIPKVFGKIYYKRSRKFVVSSCHRYFITCFVYQRNIKEGGWFLKFSIRNFFFYTIYFSVNHLIKFIFEGLGQRVRNYFSLYQIV